MATIGILLRVLKTKLIYRNFKISAPFSWIRYALDLLHCREAPGRYFFPPKKQPAEKKLGAIVRAAAEVLIVSAVAPLATRAAEAWLTAVVNAPDVLGAARGACGDGVLPIYIFML